LHFEYPADRLRRAPAPRVGARRRDKGTPRRSSLSPHEFAGRRRISTLGPT
jgi:hypothetical protein